MTGRTPVGPCLCGDPACPWCGNGLDLNDDAEFEAGLDVAFGPAAGDVAADAVAQDPPVLPARVNTVGLNAVAMVGGSLVFDAAQTWDMPGPPLVLSAPATVVDVCADRPFPPTVARLVEAGNADVDDLIVGPGTWIVPAADLPEGAALVLNAGDFAIRFRPYDLRSKPPAGMLIVEILVRTPSGLATTSGFFVPVDMAGGRNAATWGTVGRIVFEVVDAAGKEIAR